MVKFKNVWIFLAILMLLPMTQADAQFGAPIDILGPVQEDLIQEIRQESNEPEPIPQSDSIPPESREEINPQVQEPPDSRPRSTHMALHVIGVYEGQTPPGIDDRPWWAKCGGDLDNEEIVVQCHRQYAGITVEKEVVVNVSDTTKPVVLALMAYDQTLWKVNLNTGVKIDKVILAGYHSQRITGIPANVPIETYTYDPSVCENCQQSANYFESHEEVPPELLEITDLEVTSFQGQYEGETFFIK
jgi:hypothetical protein